MDPRSFLFGLVNDGVDKDSEGNPLIPPSPLEPLTKDHVTEEDEVRKPCPPPRVYVYWRRCRRAAWPRLVCWRLTDGMMMDDITWCVMMSTQDECTYYIRNCKKYGETASGEL